DEYLALCRRLECEPFITVNMGSGSVEEACQWVEYCRLEKRQPPVNIWGLGNEHYGPWQVGHYTAEEYARKAAQFGQFMQAVQPGQPGLKFMGVCYNQPEWIEAVLKRCGSMLEWVSIHLYGHRDFHDGADDFDQIAATPVFFEREIKEMADQMALIEPRLRRKEPLKICLEEWNDRHSRQGQLWRESPRNIVDALFVAGVFNVCQRLSARVTMTNYVFIVNAHSPIFVYPEGIVKTPLFDLYRLYATKMQPVAIGAEVKTESFSAELAKATVGHSKDPNAGRVSATRVDVWLFGNSGGSGGSAAGVPRLTRSPGASYAPRLSKNASRGCGASCITITVGKLASSFARSRCRLASRCHDC
ncbi:MAG: alpha-L-arabinofuranosidase C-terminal domain-containing protein, partial [Blastocatellia bacterium]